jgi:hypothetical protein
MELKIDHDVPKPPPRQWPRDPQEVQREYWRETKRRYRARRRREREASGE